MLTRSIAKFYINDEAPFILELSFVLNNKMRFLSDVLLT